MLVLHDWFGLGRAVRAFCDSLCREGFTALAPDLYEGLRASTIEEARALMEASDRTRQEREVRSAALHLRDNWHPRLGIVGFSMGASIGIEVAPGMADALVVYYGTGDVAARTWRTPLLGHFAESDPFEPLDEVEALFGSLQEAADEVDLVVHPGVGHWFASEDVPEAFEPAAAAKAWGETVAFLRYHLA